MQTQVIYYYHGVSKAKTEKAVLFLDTKTNLQAWIPTSVAHLKYLGRDFNVRLGIPGWFVNKISWKSTV